MRKRTLVSVLATALAGICLTAGSASAAELTDELGPVPVGSEIYLVSENLQKTLAVGYPWTCDQVVVRGEVTANSEGTVTLASLGAGSAAGCEYPTQGNHPINLVPTLQSMSLSAGGNTTSLHFVETSKSFPTCVSAGSLATSILENGGLYVSGQVKKISGCIGSSTAVVQGSFSLESAMGPVEVLP